MKTEQERPPLTFDGFGINGPDEYRSRVATFANDEAGKQWGALFAAAPELLAICKAIAADTRLCRLRTEHQEQLAAAITKATA